MIFLIFISRSIIPVFLLYLMIIKQLFYLSSLQIIEFKTLMPKKHYLETSLENSLLALLSHLLPDQNVSSIQDLFDAKLFYQLLSNIYPQQLKSHRELQNKINQGISSQTQTQIFKKCEELLELGYQKMGLSNKQWPSNLQIENMLKQQDLNILQQFLGGVFMLITYNKKVLITITTLDECHQKQIQQFILLTRDGPSDLPISKSRKSYLSENQYDEAKNNERWIEQLQYFQNMLEIKETQLNSIKCQLRNNNQQIQQLRTIIHDKNCEIQTLRKKLVAFHQVDTLLLQKDVQISNMQSKLTDSELKSRMTSSELSKNFTDLQEKYNNLQTLNNELQNKFNKINRQLQQAKQREQSKDIASKTVIKNLKEKVKLLQEKSQEQQRQLLEIIEEKDKRQKQFRQILYKYEGIGQGMNDQRYDQNRSPYMKNSMDHKVKSTLGDQLKELSSYQCAIHQQDGCQKQQCKLLRKQYSDLIQQIVIALDLPASAACKTLAEKSHFLQKYGLRLTQITSQNQKLKQRLVSYSQCSNSGDAEENNKLKKKLQVMKNRLKQEERKRKQESEIMTGVMQELIKNMVPQLS